MPWLLYPLQRELVAIVKKAGWAPGPVRVGAENLASPDFPACRELLTELSLLSNSYSYHSNNLLYERCRKLLNPVNRQLYLTMTELHRGRSSGSKVHVWLYKNGRRISEFSGSQFSIVTFIHIENVSTHKVIRKCDMQSYGCIFKVFLSTFFCTFLGSVVPIDLSVMPCSLWNSGCDQELLSSITYLFITYLPT